MSTQIAITPIMKGKETYQIYIENNHKFTEDTQKNSENCKEFSVNW